MVRMVDDSYSEEEEKEEERKEWTDKDWQDYYGGYADWEDAYEDDTYD